MRTHPPTLTRRAALISACLLPFGSARGSHANAEAWVQAIRRADFRGQRDRLAELAQQPPPDSESVLGADLAYWRGYAWWRRATNGFNLTPAPADLASDLRRARASFEEALRLRPGDLEARIGLIAVLGQWLQLNRDDAAQRDAAMAQGTALLRAALAEAPTHPRLLWVAGPTLWALPGTDGRQRALRAYEQGLHSLAAEAPADSALTPRWGEAELEMSLAWSCLHLSPPDRVRAERHAHRALVLEPDWHYVREILLPQIVGRQP
jgi:hypothetical protein